MAQYTVLAESVTGKRKQPYVKGDIMDSSNFVDEKHIPELVKSGAIEEIKAKPPKEEKPV